MTDIQRAYDIRQSIIAKKRDIQEAFIDLGELFSEVIDKSLWKLSGSDSLAAFCADPEIGFSEKTAYQYAGLYKRWLLEWGVDREKLIRIGPAKLEIIKKKYEAADADGREELLGRAEHNSVGDLLEDVGRPRKEGPRKVSQAETDYKERMTRGTFEEWKKKEGCCVCGDTPVEKSHMPRTVGAGALDYMWLPLCHGCHSQFHQVGVWTFMEKYGINIFIWIYNSMESLWEMRK
jgi:hypothetical protein